MKVARTITSGAMIWLLIFITFTIMSFIPVVKNSEIQQNLILYVVLIPIVIFGAKFYYKSGDKTNGFIIGGIMAVIGLILDALITVPFVIMPHNGSYVSFFINPLLWITTIEFILIVFLFWKYKVIKNTVNEK